MQSTAALVLSARGEIDYPVHLFCNVGDDSENPATITYVNEVSKPFAAAHGIEFNELRRTWKDGRQHTLLQHALKPEQRGIQIPLRGANGAPQGRNCTSDFKVGVISKWLREHGATAANKATVGIGISVDEIERAGRGPDRKLEERAYPLLDLGLRRQDCLELIAEAGLPTPPKSSCFFCPFHRPVVWREMRRDEPELFERAAQIEDRVLAKQKELGHPPLYLTAAGIPIREAMQPAQTTMFGVGSLEFEECDEGVCGV